MTTNISPIESTVMRRVRTLYAIRTFSTPLVLSAAVFVFALWGIGREVWVAHVIQNMPSLSPAHAAQIARFFEAAFLNTRFAVQVLIVLTTGAAIWFAYSIVQLFRSRGVYA